MVKALVLEERMKLSLRDIRIDETLGPRDVRIAPKVVGICGSDVHYYTHGSIGGFVVKAPMVLGHEAAGEVVEIGAEVSEFKVGDRVCMEPGIPDPCSRASRLGLYNLDPKISFWATPPDHGCLRPHLVHPADFTFALPDTVSYAEGAMVEPLAVAVQAATKARVKPGDVAVVIGAGPIGLLTALVALVSGAARVFLSDVDPGKFAVLENYGNIVPVDIRHTPLAELVRAATDGWGADLVFECSGNQAAAGSVVDVLCPGGTAVMIGMPLGPVSYDVVRAQVLEARIEHVFRYANVYRQSVAMLGSGAIDVKPLVTRTFAFDDSVAAFEYAAGAPAGEIKIQIEMI